MGTAATRPVINCHGRADGARGRLHLAPGRGDDDPRKGAWHSQQTSMSGSGRVVGRDADTGGDERK